MSNSRNSDSSRYSNCNKDVNLSLIEANLSNSIISEEEDEANIHKDVMTYDITPEERTPETRPPQVNFSLNNVQNKFGSWATKPEEHTDSDSKIRNSIQNKSIGSSNHLASNNNNNNINNYGSTHQMFAPGIYNKNSNFGSGLKAVDMQQKAGRSVSNQKERFQGNFSRRDGYDLQENMNVTAGQLG